MGFLAIVTIPCFKWNYNNFIMPRKKIERAVQFCDFQSRYRAWSTSKTWHKECDSKWSLIKNDESTLIGFYVKMASDIEFKSEKSHFLETRAKSTTELET